MKKIVKHFKKNWYRYGIETLVVVIGILIAFSLNNWNELRKTRKLEQSYLESLLQEFESNKNGLLRMKRRDSSFLQSGEMLLDLHEFGTFDGDTIAVIEGIETHGFSRNFKFKREVWNDIYSTGNALIFTNRSLQKKMSEFYSVADNYEILISDLNEYHKQFRQVNKGVIGAHFRVDFVNKLIETGTLNTKLKTSDLKYPLDLDNVIGKYRSNDLSSGILADQLMVTKVSSLQIEYFILSYIDPIIEQINQELAK